jgi:transposase
MRQDHKAGEKLFIDFPGLTIPIYDEATLEVSFHPELFVSVLGASSYLYVEAANLNANVAHASVESDPTSRAFQLASP